MPAYAVTTATERYEAIVERGILERVSEFIPARAGHVFVVTTEDVWSHHGESFHRGMKGRLYHRIFFPGGEERKRMAEVEAMAEQMLEHGGDRTSIVIAFGGGIVTDLGGFLAAIFMRGVPLIQIPTTLLAQVDAGVGGKTGANLASGKNLVGCFHQPLAVLTDPDVTQTLPDREYRAGLQEVIKSGIIRSEPLFRLMHENSTAVLHRDPKVVEQMIAESVRIKAEVVSADERENGVRRILNYGHTIGHALEAETKYARFLHGEAVALGMKGATFLSKETGRLAGADARAILETIDLYGPYPPAADLSVANLAERLLKDKKTLKGRIHWVLATGIGSTDVTTDVEPRLVEKAIEFTLQ